MNDSSTIDIFDGREICIYHSKLYAALNALFFALMGCIFGKMLSHTELLTARTGVYIIAIIFTFLGLSGTVMSLRSLLNRKPQIIVSAEGVEVQGLGFRKWEDIDEMFVEATGNSWQRLTVISITAFSVTQEVKLFSLDTKADDIRSVVAHFLGDRIS